jgi:hypothetical protein
MGKATRDSTTGKRRIEEGATNPCTIDSSAAAIHISNDTRFEPMVLSIVNRSVEGMHQCMHECMNEWTPMVVRPKEHKPKRTKQPVIGGESAHVTPGSKEQ